MFGASVPASGAAGVVRPGGLANGRWPTHWRHTPPVRRLNRYMRVIEVGSGLLLIAAGILLFTGN
ncbi:MAG: hypothetical protein GXP38_10600, partial [Chloroflexi bacterium]|nr:hypothetical protein [Chloroflexota bacterium]